MEELKSYLETIIALTTKHIAEDEEQLTSAVLREFFRGRLAVERNNLETFRKISDMVNKL